MDTPGGCPAWPGHAVDRIEIDLLQGRLSAALLLVSGCTGTHLPPLHSGLSMLTGVAVNAGCGSYRWSCMEGHR